MRLRVCDVIYDNAKMSFEKVRGVNVLWDTDESLASNVARLSTDVFHLHLKSEVHLYLWCFNADNVCIAFFEVAHGTLNAISVPAREILMRALLVGACKVICSYNHVGSILPGKMEREVFLYLRQICTSLNVIFADSLIVGSGGFYSFNEEAYYKRTSPDNLVAMNKIEDIYEDKGKIKGESTEEK